MNELWPEKPAWMLNGACINEPVAMFFLDKGDGAKTVKARRICAVCTVRAECLAFGLYENHGIWGGTTPRERRSLRCRTAA